MARGRALRDRGVNSAIQRVDTRGSGHRAGRDDGADRAWRARLGHQRGRRQLRERWTLAEW